MSFFAINFSQFQGASGAAGFGGSFYNAQLNAMGVVVGNGNGVTGAVKFNVNSAANGATNTILAGSNLVAFNSN